MLFRSDCCFNFWYRGTNNGENGGIGWNHIGFKAEGEFNSTIRFTSADFNHAVVVETDKQNYPVPSLCNFLIVGEAGGNGVIDTVYFPVSRTYAEREAYADYIIDERSVIGN